MIQTSLPYPQKEPFLTWMLFGAGHGQGVLLLYSRALWAFQKNAMTALLNPEELKF